MECRIIRVWGRADEFELEFVPSPEGNWRANIPADLSDGQYAVEIHAYNNFDESTYWTGILYMCRGISCMHLDISDITFWLKSTRLKCCLSEEHRVNIILLKREITMKLVDERTVMIIKKGCRK